MRVHRLTVAIATLVLVLPASIGLATHGGQFSIDYSAANPAAYPSTFPLTQGCPTGGRAADPIAGAEHTGGVESLTPSGMVLGQIVVFEFEVTVGGAAPADSSIEFTAGWDTVTSPAGDFGYDEDFLVYCAFVDTADSLHVDPDGDASATVASTLVGTEIQGTFTLLGLDPGDTVVVEAWLVLENRIPPGTSGNVSSRVIDAQTLTPDVDSISTGAQTIPILRVQEFRSAILVRKLIDPASDQTATFEFTGDISATLGHNELSSPVVVDDGTYTTTETVPPGWADPLIACDDDNSTGAGATATFEVTSETVICTFTNSQISAAATTTTIPGATTTAPGATTTGPGPTTTTAGATTTAPGPSTELTLDTLPFTGAGSVGLGGIGLIFLALGGMLVAWRGKTK